jgi:hypothetical protein
MPNLDPRPSKNLTEEAINNTAKFLWVVLGLSIIGLIVLGVCSA